MSFRWMFWIFSVWFWHFMNSGIVSEFDASYHVVEDHTSLHDHHNVFSFVCLFRLQKRGRCITIMMRLLLYVFSDCKREDVALPSWCVFFCMSFPTAKERTLHYHHDVYSFVCLFRLQKRGSHVVNWLLFCHFINSGIFLDFLEFDDSQLGSHVVAWPS